MTDRIWPSLTQDSVSYRYYISTVPSLTLNIGAPSDGVMSDLSGVPREDPAYTGKKENQVFFICKEIQSGEVDKSYMRKGFLIYKEMRKYFPIYEKAVSHT